MKNVDCFYDFDIVVLASSARHQRVYKRFIANVHNIFVFSFRAVRVGIRSGTREFVISQQVEAVYHNVILRSRSSARLVNK